MTHDLALATANLVDRAGTPGGQPVAVLQHDVQVFVEPVGRSTKMHTARAVDRFLGREQLVELGERMDTRKQQLVKKLTSGKLAAA